jgi:hypothetical protein
VGETKSEPPEIKVADRRKFTSEGEPLDTAAPDAETATPASHQEDQVGESVASPPEPPPEVAPAEEPGQSLPVFLELVTMLAGQAELLLVGAENLPAQPAEAQRLINYLGVLEEKTAGNLSAAEAAVLSNVLYQLRTIFLQRK